MYRWKVSKLNLQGRPKFVKQHFWVILVETIKTESDNNAWGIWEVMIFETYFDVNYRH